MRRVLLPLTVGAVLAAVEKPVDFQREIRPILSDACFHCHGPDKNTRLMDLRLDTSEGMFAQRKSGFVVLPGKSESSLLYLRISHEKEALRMPPAASRKTLSAGQRLLIRKWIEQGAQWKQHWSFVAPVRPLPPAVQNLAWVRNPIDRFILAKLEASALRPTAEADRRALVRRVSLDTTGLPPSPGDVESFAADQSPDAYEKMVDRYLASPRYGEHRARYWLDAARFGDTHGIHIDNYREMWPYRDWVIGAWNRNLPFDRFTIEQLAGDLLPGRTPQQQIASGFHRCNVTTNEGGSIPEEVAAMYAKDRVETTATVWLGLTAGCASCHDHKFDPISQREFYQLAAFFRNTLQNPMDGNIPDTPPVVFVPRAGDEKRWEELRAEIARLSDAKKTRRSASTAEFEQWMTRKEFPTEPLVQAPVWKLDLQSATLAPGVVKGAGPSNDFPALHFVEKSALNMAPVDGFDPDRPFTIALWALMPKGEDAFTVASQSVPVKQAPRSDDDTDDDSPFPHGWSIDINARIPQLRLSGGSVIRVTGNNINRLKPGEWAHLVFTSDGARDQRGLSLYINGKFTASGARPINSSGELKTGIRVPAPVRLGGEGRRYFQGGAISDFRIYNRVIRPGETAVLASWNRVRNPGPDRDLLHDFYLTRFDPSYQALERELEAGESARAMIQRRAPITHVMEENKDVPAAARILYRGQYDQPREEVGAGTPSVLPPMAASLPRNRLGLADWLMDPSNPLTARVAVNRMWQELFGAGLVKTSEDFGSQGQPPSHPELLDWLAVEFRETGWDMKRMYKLMLMSAAYRQSSAANGQKLKADPDNRLISRGPRFRMDAEMVRDLFLSAGGLLNPAIGGPSVKPYQPDGIWETVAMKGSNTRFYKQDHGDGLYRRGLYTFWKRAAPPASMEIFNAPTRENCVVRRERTNTPLQALVTLNDPQMVEAARGLAQRTLLDAGIDFDRRLDAMTARVIARPMGPRERLVVKKALGDLLSHYDSRPEEAKKLLAVGEWKTDPALPAPEFAAWTMIASNILNLDEALNK